MHAISFVLSAI